MFFNFHCSFIAVHRFKRCTVADGRLVAWFYIRHGSFIVDLLSVAPTLELIVRHCPCAPQLQHCVMLTVKVRDIVYVLRGVQLAEDAPCVAVEPESTMRASNHCIDS